MIELYVPEPVSKTQQNPIYRSSNAENKRDTRSLDDDDRINHQHQHDHDDERLEDHQTDFNVANVQITPETFLSMCPALLVQIEQGSCIERQNDAIEADDPIIQPQKDKENKKIGKHCIASYGPISSYTSIQFYGYI